MGAKDGLRWSGNIDAQRRADAAYGRLRDKPKRKKGKSGKKHRTKPVLTRKGKIDRPGWKFKMDPVPWVRPDYDDYPPVTTYSVYRQYDAAFYGRQPGTRWPVTDEAAAKG